MGMIRRNIKYGNTFVFRKKTEGLELKLGKV